MNTRSEKPLEPIAVREDFERALLALAEDQEQFSTSLYAIFFDRRPDTRCLFGEFSINEQEEMVRETLRSLLAWSEQEDWLDENLAALGRSHGEYGVEADMYAPFVDAVLESAAGLLGDSVGSRTLARLRLGTEYLVARMRQADSPFD